jgi:hypothetical protein
MVPKSRPTTGTQARAASRTIRLAVEPSGEGPYVEGLREWIERVTPRPRRSGLQLVR